MYKHNDRKGEKNPNAKLSQNEVKEIKKIFRLNEGKKTKFGKIDQGWIAEKFGVSRRTISSILNGERWSNRTSFHSAWDFKY